MKKEEFIENIINSTTGITKVAPNDALLNKIHDQIEDEQPANQYAKWLIAASIIVLISINAGIISSSNEQKIQKNELSELVPTSNNNLY